MLPGIRARATIVFRKVMLAITVAFLLALLGIFNNVGYHVNSIEELPFNLSRKFGSGDIQFSFDATYNPLLYPFYWLMRRGHVMGNFSMFFIAPGWG